MDRIDWDRVVWPDGDADWEGRAMPSESATGRRTGGRRDVIAETALRTSASKLDGSTPMLPRSGDAYCIGHDPDGKIQAEDQVASANVPSFASANGSCASANAPRACDTRTYAPSRDCASAAATLRFVLRMLLLTIKLRFVAHPVRFSLVLLIIPIIVDPYRVSYAIGFTSPIWGIVLFLLARYRGRATN